MLWHNISTATRWQYQWWFRFFRFKLLLGEQVGQRHLWPRWMFQLGLSTRLDSRPLCQDYYEGFQASWISRGGLPSCVHLIGGLIWSEKKQCLKLGMWNAFSSILHDLQLTHNIISYFGDRFFIFFLPHRCSGSSKDIAAAVLTMVVSASTVIARAFSRSVASSGPSGKEEKLKDKAPRFFFFVAMV